MVRLLLSGDYRQAICRHLSLDPVIGVAAARFSGPVLFEMGKITELALNDRVRESMQGFGRKARLAWNEVDLQGNGTAGRGLLH